MTLLGFCGMGLYGLLLSQGHVSPELLPQFSITALMFCFSGRMMEKLKGPSEEEETPETEKITVEGWNHLTTFINWIFALALIWALITFVLMPTDMTSAEMLDYLFGGTNNFDPGPAP